MLYVYGAVLAVAVLAAAAAHAEPPALGISTPQETYHYGDRLTTVILVREVTGGPAFLYISDQSGKSSSPIPLGIKAQNTTSTSPSRFEPETYPVGNYTLRIEYAGAEAEAWFLLEDSGRTIIPAWMKDSARLWVDGIISDDAFAGTIRHMASAGMIEAPAGGAEAGGDVRIPAWVMASTAWWTQDLISDEEFARGLEFLIGAGALTI